jgi:hypothetical protein
MIFGFEKKNDTRYQSFFTGWEAGSKNRAGGADGARRQSRLAICKEKRFTEVIFL